MSDAPTPPVTDLTVNHNAWPGLAKLAPKYDIPASVRHPQYSLEELVPEDLHHRAKEVIAQTNWFRLLILVERSDQPHVLVWLLSHGVVGPQEAGPLVLHAWSMPDAPLRCLPPSVWLDLFEWVGFSSEDGPPRPERPVTVYRAQLEDAPMGWSWTCDMLVAEHFAQIYMARKEGPCRVQLLKGRADPQYLLGKATERDEDEYIIHPDWRGPFEVVKVIEERLDVRKSAWSDDLLQDIDSSPP